MTTQQPKETINENKPKTVKNLSVDAVQVGTVTLRAANRDDAKAACAAIKTAGFESREAPRPEAATA